MRIPPPLLEETVTRLTRTLDVDTQAVVDAVPEAVEAAPGRVGVVTPPVAPLETLATGRTARTPCIPLTPSAVHCRRIATCYNICDK